jgi:hypothetical protein
MTIDEIRAELAERIDAAADESDASHKAAMNSYGAGYDAGFVAALRELRDFINEESK